VSRFDRFLESAFRSLRIVIVAGALALVLVSAILISGTAQAGDRSPTRTILEVVETVPALNGGFARISFPVPQGSEILALEAKRSSSYIWTDRSFARVRVVLAIDDSAPMVWRAIEVIEPPFPEIRPSSMLIEYTAGALFYDLGDFAEPPP